MKVRAHAKINLILAVSPPEPAGSPRAGFHRVASWMHTIGLFDEIEIQPATGQSSYEIKWAADAPRVTPIDWPLEKDLAVRAHRAVEEAIGRPLPLRASITKRIPVGGGLGGGSSDAGAMLRALNELFELGLSLETLQQIGSSLGSDVPFFCGSSHAALVSGFGEALDPTPTATGTLLLIIPPFGCSTAAVYRAFDQLPSPGLTTDRQSCGQPVSWAAREQSVREAARQVNAAGIYQGTLFNDLEPAAAQVEPQLKSLLERIRRSTDHPIHLTGSGACLFAVLWDQDAHQTARDLLERLKEESPGAALVKTHLGDHFAPQ